MLNILSSTTEYIDFADEINSDPDFSVPVYSSADEMHRSLLDAPQQSNKLVLGYFEEETMLGLFVFLVEEADMYLEMLMALSRSAPAYDELLAFLKERFCGWRCDFVYNPGNRLLHDLLRQNNAEFYPEQQKMVLTREVPYESSYQVELYSPKYREGYIAIHSTDVYWAAEKVIDAPDRFYIILAIENGKVVGYIDITNNYDVNEPFDVFVKESFRRKGYGKAMLTKAIELNRPKGMELTVNIDNTAAVAMYKSLGFSKVDGQNNISAHLTV